MSVPGAFHHPKVHNWIHYNHADSFRVNSGDALQFKHWMGTDRVDFERTKPAYAMYYDKDFNFMKDRDYWLKLAVGMLLTSWAYHKYQVEVDRARRTARMEGYPNEQAHHFHNRGGVVIKKDFVGFRKYLKNGDEMKDWYKMVYPHKM